MLCEESDRKKSPPPPVITSPLLKKHEIFAPGQNELVGFQLGQFEAILVYIIHFFVFFCRYYPKFYLIFLSPTLKKFASYPTYGIKKSFVTSKKDVFFNGTFIKTIINYQKIPYKYFAILMKCYQTVPFLIWF